MNHSKYIEHQARCFDELVTWTGRERPRMPWYRLRLTVSEVKYAVRRRQPQPPVCTITHSRARAARRDPGTASTRASAHRFGVRAAIPPTAPPGTCGSCQPGLPRASGINHPPTGRIQTSTGPERKEPAMTINRPAGHKPARWRPAAAVLAAAAALALAAIPAFAATASLASAPRPGIASVSFSGTSGPGVASPTITITGSRLGTTAPAGTSDNTTGCGPYTANGEVYGSKLYFTGDANFEAGFSNSSGADCVGIIVVSWSSTKVVLQFGNAYGTFDHWYLTNGDGYAISIKTAIWGGTVSGLS
jgi:hypothetical protein